MPVKLKDTAKEGKDTVHFEGEDFIRIFSNPKGDAYAFRHRNTKPASRGAKGLLDLASPGREESILPNTPIIQYFKDQYASMFREYMPIAAGYAVILQTLQGVAVEELIATIQRSAYTIEEKRELTRIMIKSLNEVLPPCLLAGDSNVLRVKDQRVLQDLCEYRTSQPDIIICSDKSATVVNGISTEDEHEITNDSTEDDEIPDTSSLTMEAEKEDFALDQTIANMIKVATDLTVKTLQQGKDVQKTTVYGIAANYQIMKGKILRLQMNFDDRNCTIQYIAKPYKLSFCINAICTALK